LSTPHERCRVLLVEDDTAIREMTKDILSDEGFDVLPTADAETALQCLKTEGPFDLLLSDVGLPGMDGRDLAQIANTLHPTMPILLVTGYAGAAGSRPDFLCCGMKLLRKPFTLTQLLGSVRSLIRRPPSHSRSTLG
jgi:two-component system cell cycle response regulator CpdR